MKKLTLMLLIICNLQLVSIFAQYQTKTDSLKQVLSTAKQDTNKAKTLLKLGYQYEYNTPDTAIFYYYKALNTAKQINNKKLIAKSYNYLGIMYRKQSNYPIALEYYQKALKINKELVDKHSIAKNLGNIGIVYRKQSNYPKALSYYQTSLKINEEIGDKSGIAANLGNIGLIHSDQRNYSKALSYYQKALKTFEELGNKDGIAANLVNIGSIYYVQSNNPKALEYYQKALKIYEELGGKSGIANNLLGIGTIYHDQSNNPKALSYYQKALKIFKQLGDKKSIALNIGNIAYLYNDLKQYKKAIEYGNKSLAIAKEIGDLNQERVTSAALANTYIGLGNYTKALEYKDKFIELNDSIFNEEKTKDFSKLEAEYKYEKKAAIDSIANAKQMEIKNAEIAKINIEKEAQRKQRNYLLIGLILILVFVGFVIRSYIQKQKANKVLAEQKQQILEVNKILNQQNEKITAQRDEITKQKEIVDEIHYEVSESINYATRLQAAVLPDSKILKKYLSEHFVLFKPKDKVSGDFYWWAHVKNHTIITAADSTGHGVPGAFMSMLGVSFLREIVQKEYVTHTGTILCKLREEIIKALKQKGEMGEQKDGMDMAIISIDHETNIVQFSGANNPLYILTNRELTDLKPLDSFKNFYEIKPDKMPIAIYEKMDNFTAHEIQLEKGDILYMFSDGFADQFGGPKGKKFKYKPFKRLLSENRDKPMKEQKELLNKAFEAWRSDLEQIDDVVVLGMKI